MTAAPCGLRLTLQASVTHQPGVEVQVGRMTASDATDTRRQRLWAEADRVNQGDYTKYQSRTDRQIPVVVLSPT